MYIEEINNQSNKPAVLIRRSIKVNGKYKKETVANISSLPKNVIENIKLALKGENFTTQSQVLNSTEIKSTVPWGHVKAVLNAMERLGIAKLIDPKPSSERSLILGLIAARIMEQSSKLSTMSWWNSCSLASELNIQQFGEVDIYKAMDWLLPRQQEIEKKLCERHVKDGDLLFADMSSTYYEGEKSPLIFKKGNSAGQDCENETGVNMLVRRGYNRDKKRGKPQINFAMLTDKNGRPISISVLPGNTSDSAVFLPAVDKIRNEFDVDRAVMVGDRGMITSKDIAIISKIDGIDWITAIRSSSSSVKKLVAEKLFHFDADDEYQFCEFSAPESYPGERLAACLNPELKKKRKTARNSLIEATKTNLDKIKVRVDSGRLKESDKIGLAVGRVIDKQKMKKHFTIVVGENTFGYCLNQESISEEEASDGIYVIRTSVPPEILTAGECISQYKNLAQVERAFRTMKTINLRIRPIFHHLDDRIKSHIFLTMLSYYVEFHLREAWGEISFRDTDMEENKSRNPAAPYRRSARAEEKAETKLTDNDLPVL
jgi:transposase